MIFHLSDLAARRGYSIFLLGAAEGVAAEAAKTLRQKYPGLRIAGVYSPPLGFEKDDRQNAEVTHMLRAARPDVCLVALGAPKQEEWMHRFSEASGVPVMMGVGATLDFVSGRVKRAPRWMQRAGLEWFWRLCAEPRRLWKRYLVDDSLFFVLLARAFVRHRLSRAARR
jgi:N-acetylglucosaminyldiphosphoundecaprenol N-acetyl-beta-D-mannosaminyltransferase